MEFWMGLPVLGIVLHTIFAPKISAWEFKRDRKKWMESQS